MRTHLHAPEPREVVRLAGLGEAASGSRNVTRQGAQRHIRPSISVVVPVYNTERYLEAALDSLLAQSQPFHEIIVVDDGSTDGSLALLRKYEQRGLVRVLTQPNRGQGLARNAGAQHAAGEWIYFFDSDDLASPRLVETVAEAVRANGRLDALLFSGDPFLDSGLDPRLLQSMPTYKRPNLGMFETFHEATLALERSGGFYVSPCLYALSREVLRSHSLRFPPEYHEDDHFHLDLVAHARRTLVLPDVLFRRRIRAGSVMTSPKTVKHLSGYLAASRRARDHLRAHARDPRAAYFRQKTIEYYMQAVAISSRIDEVHPLHSVFQRLRRLPSWKLSLRQYAHVLFGRTRAGGARGTCRPERPTV